jgi:integrase
MQAGLPADMRSHDLRHSFASIAQAEGLPAAAAMAALGHSNMSTTSGVYTHATDGMRGMAADVFDAYHSRVTRLDEVTR